MGVNRDQHFRSRTSLFGAHGIDTSFTCGAAPCYPNLIGRPVYLNIRESNGLYLSTKSFVAAPFGEFGTLARNALHGPGVNNLDLSLTKNVSVADHLRAQLGGEAFNALNHAQFAFSGRLWPLRLRHLRRVQRFL